MGIKRNPGPFVTAALLLGALLAAGPALAQKPGGVLKIYHRDSPASMSILEEATNSIEIPMMGVFNNLVLYKQDVPQNSLQSIIPDLATDWSELGGGRGNRIRYRFDHLIELGVAVFGLQRGLTPREVAGIVFSRYERCFRGSPAPCHPPNRAGRSRNGDGGGGCVRNDWSGAHPIRR
jgi:hypothetical protein